MSLFVLSYLLPWCLLGVGCWLAYQLLRQNGRMLLRVEEMQQHLHHLTQALAAAPGAAPAPDCHEPGGLPVGTPAPEFALPDLSGRSVSLADLRGRRLLLIFFNPRCGFCTQMAADLAALPTTPAEGLPLPVLVSTGDARENRKLVKEHGIGCRVILQKQMEVAAEYAVHGTPMGYLIDAEGKIESAMAVGAEALLELARQPEAVIAREREHRAGANGDGHKAHKGNRSIVDSRIGRDGLPAGTLAPEFTLPRLDGGELSLSDYGGRNVLLVFSDPHCGPCNELAPRLEQLHRRSDAVQVLMVSRGDVEANQTKAAEYGLTFPVALQRQWEISRQYAMFATPIAYRIDAEGRTAAEVAVGVEPILNLVPEAAGAAPRNGHRRNGSRAPAATATPRS